jgi:hypothetical protein
VQAREPDAAFGVCGSRIVHVSVLVAFACACRERGVDALHDAGLFVVAAWAAGHVRQQ